MSLNYDLREIASWEDLDGGLIQTIVFMSMFVGMPIIAKDGKDSFREFYQRCHAWEIAYGQIRAEHWVKPEECERFIGLKTNASRITRTAFNKQIGRKLLERANNKLTEWEKERVIEK